MKLVVGGAYQGKTEYVKREYGVAEGDILLSEQIDVRVLQNKIVQAGENIVCIGQYHLFIRQGMEQGVDMEALTQSLLLRCPSVIIIMDEVGSGIIPAERQERLYREQVGRIGCVLAKQAESVVRVVCGIAVPIK
ncbi:MAG: bifunctional adenosylcobinamide kinase/adenosylcobinamide-phosphate guanylyltransferase [Lachnospiraceae bacterium]|nr:bifunctional adenosylcobinamide kinase/adenosylcobinamide-phosphate guanylyltransferase [Lachnospiraceae bacterium]